MLIKDRLKEYIIYINCQEKYLKLYDTIRAIRWIQIKKNSMKTKQKPQWNTIDSHKKCLHQQQKNKNW